MELADNTNALTLWRVMLMLPIFSDKLENLDYPKKRWQS